MVQFILDVSKNDFVRLRETVKFRKFNFSNLQKQHKKLNYNTIKFQNRDT